MWRGLQPAPRTLTAAQSHPRTTLRRASYARSGRGARDRKLAAKPQLPHARPTYLRKHVQPSFHLRDGRADGSAAAAPSNHHREAQAAAAHLQQQRQIARCAQVGQRRMEGTDARARDLRHLGVPWERARQIWCAGGAARPLRPRRAFLARSGSKLPIRALACSRAEASGLAAPSGVMTSVCLS